MRGDRVKESLQYTRRLYYFMLQSSTKGFLGGRDFLVLLYMQPSVCVCVCVCEYV